MAVCHKIFYSTLWAKPRTENHWDEEISVEQQIQWADIAKDLERLSEIELPRCSFSQDEPVDLFLFSDASKKAYGFVTYAVQKETRNFVFCKPKVAPLIKRSLPQLELLGCLVSLQGLVNILETFKHVSVGNVYLALDAQVVLSWVLSDTIKTKNTYTANRIKDVKKIVFDIKEKFNVDVQFKYVPTSENPGDLLTRGLTLEQFKNKQELWFYGPSWIRSSVVQWPSSDLQCLNSDSQNLVMCTVINSVESLEPIVSFDRYSSYSKLLGVTSNVLKFA